MELIKNPVFIIFILLMLFCIIRGARKGMLKIIYGMISWILLLWFVNAACGYVADYLNVNTPIPTIVQNTIVSNLTDRYQVSEQAEAGSGVDGIMNILPETIRIRIEGTIHDSVEATIQIISQELSETAIRGISFIISVLLGVLLLFILNKVINLLGNIPVISEVNCVLGIITGFIEGLLLTWFVMYLADCFPTTYFGQFIISYSISNDIMNYIYGINIIEQIIGI